MFNPTFRITPEILQNVSRIETARTLVESSPLLPVYERHIKNDAVIRSVHHSTHIEGNPLPFMQVKRVLDGREDDVVAKPRDVQEILNYRKVVDFIDSISRDKGLTLINQDVIKKIHSLIVDKLVTTEEQGRYRTGLVTIRNSVTGEISYAPPRPEYIQGLMNDLSGWLDSEVFKKIHPVLRAGIILAEVARIHPFFSGNGRTSRAVSTLSLYIDGYDIKRFFSFDEYFDKDAPSYYQAIQTYQSATDDLTFWLEYFTEGMAIELDSVKERVLKLSRETKIRRQHGPVLLNERQEKILEYLQDYGRLSNSDFKKLFPEISDDTILREISSLIKRNLILKRGKTKSSYYEVSK